MPLAGRRRSRRANASALDLLRGNSQCRHPAAPGGRIPGEFGLGAERDGTEVASATVALNVVGSSHGADGRHQEGRWREGDESPPDAGCPDRQLDVDRHRRCGIRAKVRGPGRRSRAWPLGSVPSRELPNGPQSEHRRTVATPTRAGLPRPPTPASRGSQPTAPGGVGRAESGRVRRWLSPYTAAGSSAASLTVFVRDPDAGGPAVSSWCARDMRARRGP
jgi:hypothetical protein